MTHADVPVFEPGDVAFGADPFKGDEAARPWLILSNHQGRPFHGDQYIAMSLTTKTWLDDLIDIHEDDWIVGGTPDESRIIPWAIQSVDHRDIDYWQGRLGGDLVNEAIDAIVEYLRS